MLLYLACEQIVIGVKQLQRKNWVRQAKREWCTRARQPMKELCTNLDTSRSKTFALELDNTNWEIDTSLWKIFVLELDNVT